MNNKRINITLDTDTYKKLSTLADKCGYANTTKMVSKLLYLIDTINNLSELIEAKFNRSKIKKNNGKQIKNHSRKGK